MKQKLLKAADLILAHAFGSIDSQTDRLVVLAFHSVLPELSALEEDVLDPYQPLTLDDVKNVAETLRARGYRFITGRDLAAGPVKGPAAWLTFDDGYANNLSLEPLLKRLDIPATIFVATDFVERGEAYWWDILYREGRRRGLDYGTIAQRREAMKALPPQMIREELLTEFGAKAFRPVGDLDRPMTPEEVARLSTNPLVEIGNHTHFHTILPVVDKGAQRADIEACQERLIAMTGHAPVTIAYPNGNATDDTLAAASSVGLKVGVTCEPRTSRVTDISDREAMTIGRFAGLLNGVLSRELALATARLSAAAGFS
ncbi:MAG: polysaccharide deacetylase family protein [Pseudomonadota bacterium]